MYIVSADGMDSFIVDGSRRSYLEVLRDAMSELQGGHDDSRTSVGGNLVVDWITNTGQVLVLTVVKQESYS